MGLLREREDGPWLLTGATITSDIDPVLWAVDAEGAEYGSDSPTGYVDGSPNATLQPDRTISLR